MKMRKRSHRYDINRPSSRQRQKFSKFKKCLSMMMLKQHAGTLEAQFMNKLSNTQAELKKSVAHNKSVYLAFYLIIKFKSILQNSSFKTGNILRFIYCYCMTCFSVEVRTHTFAYQGVRNVSFSETFAYVLNV